MPKSLPTLALLALAAAASAQTVVLAPAAQGGFRLATKSEGWTPVAALRTSLSGEGRRATREGWAAEFDLAALPLGARIVSAALVASPSGADGLTLALRGYPGGGTMEPEDMEAGSPLAALDPAAWSSGRLDVAASLQARIDAGDRYAGFGLAPLSGEGGRLATRWSTPRLEVAYVVDHGLAKKGWPMRDGSLGNTRAGGKVTATGVLGEIRPDLFNVVVGPNGWMYGAVRAEGLGIVALDAEGVVRWRHYATGAFPITALSADGTLYVMSRDLTALDAATGQVRWSVRLQPYNTNTRKVSILDDGAVIAEQELDATAFDRDGHYLWGASTTGTAVTVDNTFAAADFSYRDGIAYDDLTFYDAHTGRLVRRFAADGTTSAPVASGNTVAWTTSERVGPPRYSTTWYNPGHGGPYWAATTAQDFVLRLWRCPTGGEPNATVLRSSTSTAYANRSWPSVRPAVPGPPFPGDLGLAPNGMYVLALYSSTEVVGPTTRYSLPSVSHVNGEAVFAISSQNVLYTGDAAYDLASGTKLWSLAFGDLPFRIIIGLDGALWYESAARLQRIR